MQTFATTALAALLSMANGHMIMNTPIPYNYKGTSKLVQVNPLGADFPFPCQGNQDIVSVTSITAGTSQLVKFTGGAQHGGGSCQFSVTYEYPPPTDPSKWKAIYTIIGGCPVSAAGNLPAAEPDADGRADSPQCGNESGTECVRQFNVPIPQDLPNGNATFAWTWYNKIGNRELYMNCAPVEISGGSSSNAFLDELPPMFFGKILEQPAANSEGSCPKADGVPSFRGAGSGSGSGADTPVVISSSALSTVTRPFAQISTDIAVTPIDGTITNSAPVATSTSLLVVPIDETTAAGSTTPAPTLIVNPTDESASAACSPDNSFFCFDSTHFGHCVNGRAIPQAVAAGTTCSFGDVAVKSRGRFGVKFFS
ncbi:hypothetical protein QBC42DRAFT_308840 [Cladorrhinum samala]|uniref:Lytic polysaccharide monooxygenase n=1 Tax=Cladorrhinum samala TaxID=585594 RepID=A0AAV9HBX2_9PEZI|nr:hypothetical protein QBC42DRAFT_308840 [Cladorrhinum samala]